MKYPHEGLGVAQSLRVRGSGLAWRMPGWGARSLVNQANGSNATPMAPTCAESSEVGGGEQGKKGPDAALANKCFP